MEGKERKTQEVEKEVLVCSSSTPAEVSLFVQQTFESWPIMSPWHTVFLAEW